MTRKRKTDQRKQRKQRKLKELNQSKTLTNKELTENSGGSTKSVFGNHAGY